MDLTKEELEKVEKFKKELEEAAGEPIPDGYCGCISKEGDVLLLHTGDNIKEAEEWSQKVRENRWTGAGDRGDCGGHYTKF